MNLPDWVQEILSGFESRTDPHSEIQISDALRRAVDAHQDMPESSEEFKSYYAEWSAFSFMVRPEENSVWGTYFAPLATATRNDGSEFRSPDIANMDAAFVTHWVDRGHSVKDPVMQARYADLVWDLKRKITGERTRPHEFAQIAIAAYLDATKKRLHTMEIQGLWWLRRALGLSRSLGNEVTVKQVVQAILDFVDEVAKPRNSGVWLFPFDALYGQKGLITPEQESKIIGDLEAMLKRTSDIGQSADFDPHAAEATADRLANHYRRRNDRDSVHRVIKVYGKAFEDISEQANSMLAMAWLQPVIERYEQEGLRAEAERLQLLSAEKGRKIKDDLKEVSTTVKITKEELDAQIEQLIGSGDLNISLQNIAQFFIPKVDHAKKLLAMMQADAPLLSAFGVKITESDGHTSAQVGSVEKDPEGRLHMQLGQTLGFYQPILVLTLERLRERYKPTLDNIFKFLGQSFLFANSAEGLLRDGLQAYEQENFVKAIHLLVPQVEHILRDLLAFLGIPTLKTVRNHPGIMDAKSMNDILSDERTREVLTEDLWRYLTVLYIEKKGGLNLRNDLAHGLVPREVLNRSTADRVFHSLLALSLMRTQEQQKRDSQT